MTASNLIRAAALAVSTMSLSACAYYGETGYYDDDGYEYGARGGYCDGYDAYDYYYDCDYRGGFANIGFGGGYYDNYYYPGYGFYIFDRRGRRYVMRDYHRNYWGRERYRYYAGRHGWRYSRDGHRGKYRDRTRWTAEERARFEERREHRHAKRDRRKGEFGSAPVRAVRRHLEGEAKDRRRGKNAGIVGERGDGLPTRAGRRSKNSAAPVRSRTDSSAVRGKRQERKVNVPAPKKQHVKSAPRRVSKPASSTKARAKFRQPKANQD